MQKLLFINTVDQYPRSEAIGWTIEDGDKAQEKLQGGRAAYFHYPVGQIGNCKDNYCYPTVLHAMGDGWRVMGYPQRIQENGKDIWKWMLEK